MTGRRSKEILSVDFHFFWVAGGNSTRCLSGIRVPTQEGAEARPRQTSDDTTGLS